MRMVGDTPLIVDYDRDGRLYFFVSVGEWVNLSASALYTDAAKFSVV